MIQPGRTDFAKVPRILPVIIFLAGLGIRSYRYFSTDLWYDEGVVIYECLTFGLSQHIPLLLHPPLYNLIVYLWLSISTGIHWIKILPLLWGALGLATVYLAGKKLFNRTSGLWAMAILSVMPMHVYYSRDLKMYGAQTALSILLWYFIACHYHHPRPRYLIAICLVATASLYTHYFLMFPLASAGFIVLLLSRRKKHMLAAAGSLIVALTLFLPWTFRLFTASQSLLRDSDFFAPPLTLRYMVRVLTLLVNGYHGLKVPAGIANILLFGLVVYGLIRAKSFHRTMVFGMVLMPLILHYLVGYFLDYEYIISRYLTYLTGALAIVGGIVLARLPKKLSWIVGSLIIISCMTSVVYLYQDKFRGWERDQGVRPHEEYSEPTHFIAENWADGDMIGHACVNSWPSFYYYLKVNRDMSPGVVLDMNSIYRRWFLRTWKLGVYEDYYYWVVPSDINAIAKSYKRLWFIASEFDIGAVGTFNTDFTRELTAYLTTHYRVLDHREYYGCPVYLLDLKTPQE